MTMIRHKFEPSVITPGRCGASELATGTQGYFRCCGKPESAETHKEPKPVIAMDVLKAIVLGQHFHPCPGKSCRGKQKPCNGFDCQPEPKLCLGCRMEMDYEFSQED